MKKLILLAAITVFTVSAIFAQNNVLVVDYNNNFSSDQSNNQSRIYNRLLTTQTSVTRVNAIPATINQATYQQVWIFGNMGTPSPATLNPIITYMNNGGAVYIQSEVSCCTNPANFADQLINATVTVGGSITHNTMKTGNYQYEAYSPLVCTPMTSHGAAVRPFVGATAQHTLYEANPTCGGAITTGDVIGVRFSACDMITGEGALIVNGDFNIFPLSGTCGSVGILGTPNNFAVIDLISDLLPALACSPLTNPGGTLTCTANPQNFCGSTQLGWYYTGPPGCPIVGCDTTTHYKWTVVSGEPMNVPFNFSCDTCPYPIASPSIITTYTLSITKGDTNINCPRTSTVIPITVFPNSQVTNAGLDTTICFGDSVAIGGSPTAIGAGPFVYSWTPTTGLNNPTLANPVCTPTGVGSTTYIVQATGPACSGYDTIVVNAISCCAITITDTTNVNAKCFGSCDGSISLTTTGGATQYSIDNGATWQASNIFSGLCAGTYTLLASDGNCSDAVTVTIFEPTAISIPNVVTDASCFGGSDGQIVVAPQGGTPSYNYSWSVAGQGNSPTANNLTAGTYTVTITDANGCTEDSTFVINEPAPVAFGSFTSNVTEGCSPLEVEFTHTTNPALFSSFLLDLGNGLTSSSSPVSTTYTTPGSYDVTLTVTDNNGCIGILVETAYITVHNNPVANFSTWPQRVTVFDPTVNFKDLSQSNIVAWDWNFDNLGNSSLQNPSFTFAEDTANYNVELIVEDNHGCKDTITKSVEIKGEFGVYVPNAFTPDNDGLNEGFKPDGFGVSDFGYSFVIFDRWGEVIFKTSKKFDPWNGTYKGKLVENGVYIWSLNFKDLDGLDHKKVGHVTILK